MSDDEARPVALGDVAALMQRGGDFVEERRFKRAENPPFVQWGRKSFRPVERAEPPAAPMEQAPPSEGFRALGEREPAQAPPVQQEPAPQPPPPPPPPPPPLADPGPTPQEIIAALDKAREDGRALGYQQGLDAARRELGEAIELLRKLEKELLSLAQDEVARTSDIMAHHVRRIAQDLFGAVFAEMPETFVQRIKNAAEMFTKAGTDFTLTLNPRDLLTLASVLRGVDLFNDIRIIEGDDVPSGAFRLSSRDLDYEDAPVFSDAPD